MKIKKVDKINRFISVFDTETGFYMRSGVFDAEGKETQEDPFMADMPELLDIGIMGHCINGMKGLCGVQCYQNGMHTNTPNMPLSSFKTIVDQCKGKVFQFALGGRGDVDQHEEFEDILKYCNENNIVPNFTSSGLGFTDDTIRVCKEQCGAVAISWYRQTHTVKAINSLINAGVKTNIHYVLGNNSIDEAIDRLKNGTFPKGINAIIFLLHKPVGLGQQSNVLKVDDPKVKEFYAIIDEMKFDFKVGFDSCNVPAILNFTSRINRDSIDTCEGGRYSAYIGADMNMIPCSFDNQEQRWAVNLNENTVHEAWHSEKFNEFRSHFTGSCGSCKDRLQCLGGCIIRREIVLCDREEKDLI